MREIDKERDREIERERERECVCVREILKDSERAKLKNIYCSINVV